MKKTFLMALLTAIPAVGAFGSYQINPAQSQFYFEDETTVRLKTQDNWYDIYAAGGTAKTSGGKPVMESGKYFGYHVTMKTEALGNEARGKTVKGWGLSKNYITAATWNDNNSTNCTFYYDSQYEGSGTVNLFLRLRWFRYELTFESNGGTAVSPMQDICYTNNIVLPAPTRAGYDFEGWTNDTFTSAIGGSKTGDELGVAADGTAITLYAKWTPKTFDVTFNPNGAGATVDPTETTVTYDSVYGPLPTPVWAGHGFAGWFTDATDGTQIQSNDVVSITANQTLYAKWSQLFTVTFQNSSGSIIYKQYTNVVAGSRVEPPDISEVAAPEGQIFTGEWSSSEYENVTRNLIILPKFYDVQATLTVTRDPTAGGTYTLDDHGAGLYEYGRTVTLTAVPSAAYDFAGWSDGSMDNPHDVRVITDTNIVVRFTLKKFRVAFLDWDGITTNDTRIVEYGSAADAPEPIEHPGYTFTGWSAGVGSVTSNMTVVAQYAANRYTVVYDANGGGGSMTNDIFTYGTEYDLQSNAYTRVLYEFVGWASNPDAATNEVEYVDGAAASNLTAVANGTNTLYAVWQSQLSDLSVAVNCTNLLLVSNNGAWGVDNDVGFESSSSAHISGRAFSRMTTMVEGIGTLTFRVRSIRTHSDVDVFAYVLLEEDGHDPGRTYVNNTSGEWIPFAYSKTDLAPRSFEWRYAGWYDDDQYWVDQVHWYPGKRVTVQGDNIDSSVEAEATEAILQNWDSILGASASSVSNVVAKGPAVTNAVALLNSGYRPEVDTSVVPPTLTFNEAVLLDISISEFSVANLPTATLKAIISPHGTPPDVGVWGAPTLTSDWSRVITTDDFSAFAAEGIVSFEFDVSTNRFFKVITK